jgi:ubiquinone/menaquinone biosynthesis C-methylase UbiE
LTRHDTLTDTQNSQKAKDYDAKPWQKKIAAQVAEALDTHADWLGAKWVSANNNECRLLDYACGTGSVTRALSTRISHATGIDISSQMLSQYTTLLSTSHPHLSLSTTLADFCSASPDTNLNNDTSYNIAGVALGFHHLADPQLCMSRLAQQLQAQTGVLFIIDWLPKDIAAGEHHHGHQHAHPVSVASSSSSNDNDAAKADWQNMKRTIKTNGFTKEDMSSMFEKAGFVDFEFVVLEEKFALQMNGHEVEKTGFIAKGRKA